jgi:hypothetical protein
MLQKQFREVFVSTRLKTCSHYVDAVCFVFKDRVTLINTLADGYYFRSLHPHGQLCLTAAAWAGSGKVIETLVKHGGMLTMKNLAGNTLLHSIILQSAKFPGKRFIITLLYRSNARSIVIFNK